MEDPKFYKEMSENELLEKIGQSTQTPTVSQSLIQLVPAVVLLGRYTENVRTAVSKLTNSSNRLERLTCTLIVLTIVLVALTVVLAMPHTMKMKLLVWLKTWLCDVR